MEELYNNFVKPFLMQIEFDKFVTKWLEDLNQDLDNAMDVITGNLTLGDAIIKKNASLLEYHNLFKELDDM